MSKKIQAKQIDIANLQKELNSIYVQQNGTDRLMTDAEGTKLSGIETGAEVNVIESIKVNNVDQTVSGKSVNITVPTKASDIGATTEAYVDSKISELVNGADSAVDTLKELADLIEDNQTAIDALQKAADANTTYDLVGKSSGTNGNVGISLVGSNDTEDSIKITGAGSTSVTSDAGGNIVITSTDANTTYDLIGKSSGTNGNVGISLVGNNSTEDVIKFTGAGGTEVTSDASGNIIITTDLSGKANTGHTHTITYTPAGTVSSHSHNPTVSTTSVYSITAVGTLPSCTLPTLSTNIINKCMTITWTAGTFSAGTLPTKGEATTVATGVTIGNTQPTFTGTEAIITSSI